MARRLLGLLATLAVASTSEDFGMSYGQRLALRDAVVEMHGHAHRAYMAHAFPHDELMPLSCQGRRWDKRRRGTLDDVLGGYLMTLVDGADTMLTIGDYESFAATLDVIATTLTFDRDVTVSTFEACIRVLGGLLSAHYLVTADALRPAVLRAAANATDPAAAVDRWARSLRSLATDLGRRLLPAFDTPTGIPAHRVNLRRGVATSESRETCSAAAGTMLLEMSKLSALTGDGRFEAAARRALDELWRRRSKVTDLVGSTVHTHTGQWLAPNTGVGAGVDSYYEYMVKAAIFLDDAPLLHRGLAGVRAAHNETSFRDPASALLWNVEVYRDSGRYFGHRVSALQAFWPSLLLMAGDVGAARDTFKAYWSVWRKYKSLPELFDLSKNDVLTFAKDSPLRPELAESALHLYLKTRDAHFLVVGRELVAALNNISRVPCGFASIADATTHRLDDRMDSYFFAETLKYLFLLFDLSLEPADRRSFFCCDDDDDDPADDAPYSDAKGCPPAGACVRLDRTLFSTEGHFFEVPFPEALGPFGSLKAGLEPVCDAHAGAM